MKHLKTMIAITVLMLMGLSSIASAQYPSERLNRFLDGHQKVKAKLERNPDLIYDRRFREDHPELQAFMQQHPEIYGKLHNSGRWGAYGPDHEWHESDWWHEHDPGWMYQNHPEWAEEHADWREDREHHPEWFKHEEHEEHEEAEHHQTVEETEHQHGNHGEHGDHGDHGNHGDHGDHDHGNH
jgi:hypothetical protein